MAELVTFGCGAGTQSTALYLLMRDGVIPPPDLAIFADTGAEPQPVYANVRYLRAGFEQMGIPFHVVGRDGDRGDICGDVLNRQVWATLPAFTVIRRRVSKPLWWDRCDCDWGRVFGVGGEGGVDALHTFAPGVSLPEIEEHPQTHLGCGDCDTCRIEDLGDGVVDLGALSYRSALMMHEAGLVVVPEDHAKCRSTGRIVTREHTYTKVEKGRIRRTCTAKYKIEPIERDIRIALGAVVSIKSCRFCVGTGQRIAPWDVEAGIGPCAVCRGTGQRRLVSKAPAGSRVRHIIGFSADEAIDRATTAGFPRTTTPIHPLIDLGMTRTDCEELIRANGLEPVKSACVPCPFHGNRYWRDMRDNRPDEWSQAVMFDREFRRMPGLDGERFLHESCLPLDEAPIDKPTASELASAQGNLFARLEEGAPGGCSPYACRSSNASNGETVSLPMPTVLRGVA